MRLHGENEGAGLPEVLSSEMDVIGIGGIRTLTSCASPSLQEYTTSFLLHPTISCVTMTGIVFVFMCAELKSAPVGDSAPAGNECSTDEWMANENAAFAFTRGVGGDSDGTGSSDTVMSASTTYEKAFCELDILCTHQRERREN